MFQQNGTELCDNDAIRSKIACLPCLLISVSQPLPSQCCLLVTLFYGHWMSCSTCWMPIALKLQMCYVAARSAVTVVGGLGVGQIHASHRALQDEPCQLFKHGKSAFINGL